MKKLVLIAFVVYAAFYLKGCVVAIDPSNFDGEYDYQHDSWQDKERFNRSAIQALKVGQSYDVTSEKLGAADFNEFKIVGDTTYQVLYYRTQRQQEDGMTTKDECTPLLFANGELLGWGEDFVQTKLKS